MTNRHASKQHGLSKVKQQQPKSKIRKRVNKAKAALRKAERRAIINGESAQKKVPTKAQKPKKTSES